jgi:phosphoserine aminotransferase
MLNFYPGPSKLYPQVKEYLMAAYDSGILSMNHRSSSFVDLVKTTVSLLKSQLQIPSDYHIYFVSSATECWEIIAQSFVNIPSIHLYNGEFGKKWADIAKKYIPTNLSDTTLKPVICLTHNETSNGNYLPNATLETIRTNYSNTLIAIDATSSMAGLSLSWQQADIWFASVQKCFGLPSGLALLVCSPAAVEQGLCINENNHYNSFVTLHKNMQEYQTTHTPNILVIYLLCKLLQGLEHIAVIDKKIRSRAKVFYDFLHQNSIQVLPIQDFTKIGFDTQSKEKHILFTHNLADFSPTVITLTHTAEKIAEFKEKALKNHIILGNGYGRWKDNTLRIANFPALIDEEFEELKEFFQKNLHYYY